MLTPFTPVKVALLIVTTESSSIVKMFTSELLELIVNPLPTIVKSPSIITPLGKLSPSITSSYVKLYGKTKSSPFTIASMILICKSVYVPI